MDLGLHGRVWLVTGGSKGLGLATAAALVADGARVVISSRDQANVDAALDRLNGPAGPDRPAVAAGAAADQADPGTPRRLLDLALERFGRLDGALVSVGGPPPGSAASATDEQWRAAFESVFLGALRCARTVAGHLAGQPDGGAVALVLSTSARSPLTGLGISNGLRPGLAMAAKDLADEYGPRGVRVLGLMPGRIATDRLARLDAADPAGRQAALDAIPLRRYGTPEEFGRVAAFLLSPAAGYVTGSLIAVDGGALRTL
ncbi:SDR family oxidoreductase [Streptomyces aidingensis]|uniref:3-oxoacyl-[acyl-carrier protein] reductase n=1 Tax=Streptomyces aidingensis TaxID=910347 RepID=A0A1I1HQU0_9ACTN|nr:SDR family oxidoreductase [Streptomyces aidingensis]SFC26226.1 3-oxoacyl-[acyl-carrier protein] reductase [Streptomyces aidingensis]